MKLYLGIDGGQSHTTALIADRTGKILGEGHAGPSNHTREPGGRERLISAVTGSVGEAAAAAGLAGKRLRFAAAHLALTGEPEEKIDIVNEILTADYLRVGHDAPGALAGALVGNDGAIVLAGTGSVACGQITRPNGERDYIRVGGHGYLFSDEGSALAIAREGLRLALRLEDEGLKDPLQPLLLRFFRHQRLKAIAQDCYAGLISRDHLASFAAQIGRAAERRPGASRQIIDRAALELANLALVTVRRLGLTDRPVNISYAGGVFRNQRLLNQFTAHLANDLPLASLTPPRFGPEIGALILAYLGAGRRLTAGLVGNISSGPTKHLQA